MHVGARRLQAEMGCRCAGDVEAALEVHIDHRVPLRLAHLVEDAVAENACVVDDRVDSAENIDRLLNHAVRRGPVGNRVRVQHRLATCRVNGVDHLLAGARVMALATGVTAKVVYNQLGALGGHQHCDAAAHAAPAPVTSTTFPSSIPIRRFSLVALLKFEVFVPRMHSASLSSRPNRIHSTARGACACQMPSGQPPLLSP